MDMAVGKIEAYLSAGNSKDLTVRAGRLGDVDALVSVAWSRGKVGHALLRLHSEWDGAARRGLKLEQVFRQLKALPEVQGALFAWAIHEVALPPQRERLEDADDLVGAILVWWLDRTCKTCSGTKWVTRAFAPKAPCTSCHGTGEARIPRGEDGRGMVAFMESCLYRHRASIKGRAARNK